MTDEDDGSDGLRLDKWLWHARFCKTRGVAAKLAARRKVRINRMVVTKPHFRVRPGDILTFPMGNTIRVVRVLALGGRRGPASEATGLYEDLADENPG